MKTIELKDYEINDLMRTLQYAKKKKILDCEKGVLNKKQCEYEIGIIDDLIARVPVKTYKANEKEISLIELI